MPPKKRLRSPKTASRSTAPAAPHGDPSEGWTRLEETRVHGRALTRGTEVSIRGERGRFRFLAHVRTDKGVEWLDFIGGVAGKECFRSFAVDRVRTVHRITKTRANNAPTRKAAR